MTSPRPDLVLLDGVSWRGTPITGQRVQSLLGALVLRGGRAVGDDRLVAEIWREGSPAHPTKALQVLVSRARSATAPHVVERVGAGYRLGEAVRASVDVLILIERLEAARVAWRAGDAVAASHAARRATGESVAAATDDLDGPLGEVRDAARRSAAAARLLLGLALSARGEHDDALVALESVLADHRDDESLLVALLHSEAVVRGPAAALDHYETYRRDLRDRLGSDPGVRLKEVYAELLAQDQPVRSGVLFEHNRLVGRADDIAELDAMLRGSRVTSIVGAGGLGKTRLAHLMGRRAEQPVVYFVELAGVTSPEGVVVEVGSALGVRDSLTGLRGPQTPAHRTDLRGRILESLALAPTLLILDNCEHVLDAVADLVTQVVGNTHRLTVLTTSRAPLGVAAERVYQLPQLSLDDGVELFGERATAARPGVLLPEVPVRQLVERLDGLPLAIELAAAKVRALSIADISRLLANRFELLRGGDRGAPERHQTLLAVIDWSWNLLDENGRVALRRISVFPDGFGLDGATAVIAGGADPIEAVEDLVQQSLLSVQEEGDAVRYRLLETVREFARMQLVDAGEAGEAERAIRRWALELCTSLVDRLFSPDQAEVMDRIREEEGNLSDLLHRAIEDADPSTVVLLMATLGGFWSIEGSHLTVITLSEAVVGVLARFHPPPEQWDQMRSVLSLLVANSTIITGTPIADTVSMLRELRGGTGDRRIAAVTELVLALAETGPGRLSTAIEELGERDDPVMARLALQWCSHAHENSGDIEGAITLAHRALAMCDDLDGEWSRASLNGHLAGLAVQSGDLAAAREHALAALRPLERLRAADDVSQMLALLALCDMAAGDLDQAQGHLDAIDRADGSRMGLGGAIVSGTGRAELALARGEVDEGLGRYRAVLETMRTLRLPFGEEPEGSEPWVVFTESAALAAHVVHGRGSEAADLYQTLVTKLGPFLTPKHDDFLDYPVAGAMLFAVALALAAGAGSRLEGPDRAGMVVRLLVVADRVGYNRTVPALAWHHAVRLVGAASPGALDRGRKEVAGCSMAELRNEARELVARL